MQLWSTIIETKGDNYAIMTYNYRCQGRQLRNYEKPKVQLCDTSRTLVKTATFKLFFRTFFFADKKNVIF